MLFYNPTTGAAAVGSMNAAEFTTKRIYPAGAFKAGWTDIVGANSHPLFYDRNTGEGALGFDPVVQGFPKGAFAKGWTHAVPQTDRQIIK